MAFRLVAVVLVGYLLGAIPFGAIATRLTRGVDVTEYGSGKIGATNVLRTGGVKAAAIVFFSDIAKGAAAVVLAAAVVGAQEATLGSLTLDFQTAQVAAALAAVVGHNWSVFIGFRGGRGVCTFFGALLAMSWPVGLSCGAVVIGTMWLTRYASLGSLAGISASFLVTLLLAVIGRQPVEYLGYTVLAGGLIFWQHRDNIQRLRAASERRLGEKAGDRWPSPVRKTKG